MANPAKEPSNEPRPPFRRHGLSADCRACLSAETVAITNAKIETVGSAGEIANGTVVIKDGKIAAVGAAVKAPAGARIIDAEGKVVTPGLIAASTNLTVAEVDGVRETRDDQAGGKLGAAFDVQYGVNPASTIIPLARQGGITRAMVTPIAGRGFGGDEEDMLVTETAGAGDAVAPAEGLFAGQAAAVRLTADDTDPVFKAKAAMVVDLGDSGARIAGSHAGSMMLLRSALDDVRAYAAHKDAYERGQTRAYALLPRRPGSPDPGGGGADAAPGAGASRASDIRQVIKLAREQHLKLVIEGAEEGWLVAPDLAAVRHACADRHGGRPARPVRKPGLPSRQRRAPAGRWGDRGHRGQP